MNAPSTLREPAAAGSTASGLLSCVWSQSWEGGMWETGCKHAFEVNDGLPSENGMQFCCFCGRTLVEHPYQEEQDNAPAERRGTTPES